MNGPSKKGVVTVSSSENDAEETPKKRRKVIRKKVIKKVVKKPQAEKTPSDAQENKASAENGEAQADKQVVSDSGEAGIEK